MWTTLLQRRCSLSITFQSSPLPDRCLHSSGLRSEKGAFPSVSNSKGSSKRAWSWGFWLFKQELKSAEALAHQTRVHLPQRPHIFFTLKVMSTYAWLQHSGSPNVKRDPGSLCGFTLSSEESYGNCLGSCCLFYFILKKFWWTGKSKPTINATLTSPLPLSLILLVVSVSERCLKSSWVLTLQSSTGNRVHSCGTASRVVN